MGALALLLGSLTMLSGCTQRAVPSSAAVGEPKGTARSVKVVAAGHRKIDRVITALGSLEAKQSVVLSAKVSGRLRSIEVDLGSPAASGESLACIEPRDYELKVQQVQGALAQARARLGLPLQGADDAIDPGNVSLVREARAVFDQAEVNRARAHELSAENLISKSELEEADVAHRVAENRYHTALDEARQRQAALAERKAELEMARQELADTRIVAPFGGIIQTRHAHPGQYLKEGDPIVTLVQVDPLRLRLEIPERDVARVRPAQEVRFSLTSETRERVATIVRIQPGLDSRSRMLLIEADVANDGSLHPGVFAEGRIVVEPDADALVILTRALRTFAGLQKVFVVENGVALEKEITTGTRGPDWMEVLTGLKDGDRVVLDPGNLRNGDRVTTDPS